VRCNVAIPGGTRGRRCACPDFVRCVVFPDMPIPLAAVLLVLAWALAGVAAHDIVATRLQWIEGATLVGKVVRSEREDVRGAGSRGRQVSWRIAVQLEDRGVEAGEFTGEVLPLHRIDSSQGLPEGMVLRLKRLDDGRLVEHRFGTYWSLPLLGAGPVLLALFLLAGFARHAPRSVTAANIPRLPRAEKRRLRAEARARRSADRASGKTTRRQKRILVCAAVLFALLAAGDLFNLLAVQAMFGALLSMLMVLPVAFGAGCLLVRQVPVNALGRPLWVHRRPGIDGWLVDSTVAASGTAILGLLTALLMSSVLHRVDRLAPRATWSVQAVNELRTALWLPGDFDVAWCQARRRGNQPGMLWLEGAGALRQDVCHAQ